MSADNKIDRIRRFKETTGALSGGANHPDRCVCQDGPDAYPGTPHTHYQEPPYSCARCSCSEYRPAVTSPAVEVLPQPARMPCPYCGIDHIDAGEWQTRPHHKHLCLHCGKLFRFEGADGEYFYGVADPDHYP